MIRLTIGFTSVGSALHQSVTPLLFVAAALLGVAEPSLAVRNDLELLPLFDISQPLEACGQKAAAAISYKNEHETPSHLFLFIRIKDSGPALPPACFANPLTPSCFPYFSNHATEIGDFHKILFNVELLPALQIFVGAITDNPTDSIAYSKVVEISFRPCQDTTTTPFILPGNGSPSVSTANRGPATHELYNEEPVAKWASDNMQLIGGLGSPAEYTVSLVANEKNIDTVYFIAESQTGQIGHVEIPGNQPRMDRENGVKAYTAKIRAIDFTPGKVTIRAIVVPRFGKVVLMHVPITSWGQRDRDRHEIEFENNRDNHIITRSYYIVTNGVDNATCGSSTAPCRTMMGATLRHKNLYGNNFSGVTLKFGAGTFTYGSTLAWPGISTPNGPLVIEGTVNSLGKKLTTFNRAIDITNLGYPGQPVIGGNNLLFRDINVASDPTGPSPRGYILGIGSSSPYSSFIVRNMDFKGLARNPGNCLGQSDPLNTTYATYRDVTLRSFQGNGNQHSNIRTFVSHNSSIAFSDSDLILNSAASVNQTVSGCTPTTTPHGDLVKTAPGNLYLDGFFVPTEDAIVAQGFYPTGDDIVVKNAFFRVAEPGQTGYGASLLMGDIRNVYVENSSFEGGPRRYGPCETGSCDYQGVYFHNSFETLSLPSNDSIYSQSTMPGNPFLSPLTGVTYSTGGGSTQ